MSCALGPVCAEVSSFDTRSNLGILVLLSLVILDFISRIRIVHVYWTYIEGVEHYGSITDISTVFKVTDRDTCSFVRISCTVLYSNGVLVLSVVDRIE